MIASRTTLTAATAPTFFVIFVAVVDAIVVIVHDIGIIIVIGFDAFHLRRRIGLFGIQSEIQWLLVVGLLRTVLSLVLFCRGRSVRSRQIKRLFIIFEQLSMLFT